jgi:hypothetical protein
MNEPNGKTQKTRAKRESKPGPRPKKVAFEVKGRIEVLVFTNGVVTVDGESVDNKHQVGATVQSMLEHMLGLEE